MSKELIQQALDALKDMDALGRVDPRYAADALTSALRFDDDTAICNGCAGSGEGMTDGSTCRQCRGSGETHNQGN